jgi:SAM-dependent methyltransferase
MSRFGPPFDTILDVDFGQLYRNHMSAAEATAKPPKVWDARAAAMDRRMRERESYVTDFIGRLDAADCATLLDVGGGQGTIALALASRFERIILIDYSPAMLDLARRNAEQAGVENITFRLRSWDDDWCDVPVCDMAIASRSTAVADLESALAKLDAKARKSAAITSFVGGRSVDRSLLEAIGRPAPPSLDKPDYIYAINLLHRMGRLPRLDYIARDKREDAKQDAESFRRSLQFVLGALDDAEWRRALAWRERQPSTPLFERDQDYWAFIAWRCA